MFGIEFHTQYLGILAMDFGCEYETHTQNSNPIIFGCECMLLRNILGHANIVMPNFLSVSTRSLILYMIFRSQTRYYNMPKNVKRKQLASDDAEETNNRRGHTRNNTNGNKKPKHTSDHDDTDEESITASSSNRPTTSRNGAETRSHSHHEMSPQAASTEHTFFKTYLSVFKYTSEQIYELFLSHGISNHLCEFFLSEFNCEICGIRSGILKLFASRS